MTASVSPDPVSFPGSPVGVTPREVPGPAPRSSRRSGGRFFLAVPLVLVNAVAVWGQAGWAYEHIAHGIIAIALLFALAVESIGIYLAWESHESLMADQASFALRAGSYSMGLLAGVLNFLHFSSPGGADDFTTGIAFGALSTISPWLWAVWSRARNRNRLAELGLVDVRAVKLSAARKLWHPIRSVRVVRWAAWSGVTSAAAAVAGWEEARAITAAQTASETPVKRTADETRAYIRDLREKNPTWTQEQLAAAAGCSSRWVRQVLNAS